MSILRHENEVRKNKGMRIAAMDNGVKDVKGKYWKVKSISSDGFYVVEKTEIGWTCNCPDHKNRGMKCKHIWAVLVSLGLNRQPTFERYIIQLKTTEDFKEPSTENNLYKEN